MLQLIRESRNSKTGNIPQTYRTGPGSLFSSCPATCPLNPSREGASKVDREYLRAVIDSVPAKGTAWTYTHFPLGQWARQFRESKGTVINFSADSDTKARHALRYGIPVTLAAPGDHPRVDRRNGVRYVACPATYLEHVNCANCGGGKPLCARRDRDYVIVFPAHGASAKLVGSQKAGGCYAAGGNTGFHWRKLMKRADDRNDAAELREWVRALPRRSMLRHHVAGDLGRISP